MSKKPKKLTTDELCAKAVRRVFPPFTRVYNDKNIYNRKVVKWDYLG